MPKIEYWGERIAGYVPALPELVTRHSEELCLFCAR
uniref:Uncharacterized protein n=1 Tax=Siphoviridae sp. ctWDo30 TaxID=2826360 RepID=A0A8S5N637_9CAUD|nr:MAG TPA: hypothetical protein [Siphoviridae sp. ctWDo30]